MMGTFAVTSFMAGSLDARLGSRVVLSAGAVCLGVGMLVLSFVDETSTFGSMIPGMLILGIGVGLFSSSITTVAVTALDESRSSLAGGIVYMCQIAGGAVGLGLNTAIVASGSDLVDGISTAFRVDAALAVGGLILVELFLGRSTPAPGETPHPHALRWRHRVHA